MPVETDAEVREILGKKTVAVVGWSSTLGRDAYEIPKYLQVQGYEITRSIPTQRLSWNDPPTILSTMSRKIEIVNAFRPSAEVAGIVDEALGRDNVDVIWLQLGIHDDEAVTRAEAAGLHVVQDRCMKPENGQNTVDSLADPRPPDANQISSVRRRTV